jgi:diamine N-acetyltransferase
LEATFYTTGMEHSPTRDRDGWERTLWHTTKRAALEVLKKGSTA